MESEVKKRVKEFIDNEGITISEFEKSIGASNGYVNSIAKGIGGKRLDTILRVFPNLDKDWLLYGQVSKAPKSRYSQSSKFRNDNSPIPYYDVDFEAGSGIEFYDDLRDEKPAYMIEMPDFSGCTAFRTCGKSMQPLIESGSILFGTKESGWDDFLELGQIYGIVLTTKRRLLKYVHKRTDTYFTLRSANPDFEDVDLPFTLIKSIWMIHGWVNKYT